MADDKKKTTRKKATSKSAQTTKSTKKTTKKTVAKAPAKKSTSGARRGGKSEGATVRMPQDGAGEAILASMQSGGGHSPGAAIAGSIPPQAEVYGPPRDIPRRYGVTHIQALVKDPHWVYAYWEVTEEALAQARDVLHEVWHETVHVLRVYDVTDGEESEYFDVELSGDSDSWYIHVGRPARSFAVAIGLRGPGGMFYELARSRAVTMPRDDISDIVEEEWARADEEFAELYRASGVHEHHVAAGSVDFREIIRQRMESDVASGALSSWMFSMGSQVHAERRRERGFWFVLNTELIVYGATEPDATVTVQGKEVPLRPDGTFTLRFALPDGEQVIPCIATSADKIEQREITPTVSKSTATPEPRVDREAEAAFLNGGDR